MNSILFYILTGILFIFPFLSPSQGVKVLPSFQIDYLTELQAGEEKGESGRAYDQKIKNVLKRVSQHQTSEVKFKRRTVDWKSDKEYSKHKWNYTYSSEASHQKFKVRSFHKFSILHRNFTTQPSRSVVLRI